ncbi:MAG: DNA mismatch repair protein MutS [archaeon]|nr:DNA mismatch repair protein MutS [archaeon]
MVDEIKEVSILNIPSSQLTPGMKQYQEAKMANPDCLIMLRMGDFYEMFYEDAITASRELEITLTARGQGEKRAPLAGIPFHALEPYLGRLVKKGHKVAIIEQLEDPKKAKGLVKRGLVRIVTPGTLIESSLLEENENNYLAALTSFGNSFALAFSDFSTGEFFTTTHPSFSSALNELIRFSPRECLIPASLQVNQEIIKKMKDAGCFLNPLDDSHFKMDTARSVLLEHFNKTSLDSFGMSEYDKTISSAGALLYYLTETQRKSLNHITKISVRSNTLTMLLEGSTYRNLELVKNMRDGSSKGTLLEVLDKTVTAMGARMLKQWLKNPLLHVEMIDQRLGTVEVLVKNLIIREELNELFRNLYDMERLISRINYGNANPKDLLAMKQSLAQIPKIQKVLHSLSGHFFNNVKEVKSLEWVQALLENSIRVDAPLTLREGGMIKPGYNQELAALTEITKNSKSYLQKLEQREKEKTGISTLKIGYTRVFGYYIEVTRKNVSLVPPSYIRKQTTANSERYITEELKLEEEKILGAQEKMVELEYSLYQELLHTISEKTSEIQQASIHLAALDVLCSFAKVAAEHNYVKPLFVEDNILHIKNGRHPVIEQYTPRFIANDVLLNNGEMMIITGPNMAGKSTVMRQTALIVLMAQIGSFVPAEEVILGITDRIFTRVGAHDDLTSGQSTFMVEMNETASILNNATRKSLIILDEIGRGTSTFDGVSIAWSVAEHIYNSIKAKTLFATHYHVMNKLADKCSRVKNYTIAVREKKGDVVFLHKLIPGSTDQSYGIHVAQLAGLPSEVVLRAREIQNLLEKDDDMMKKLNAKKLEDQKNLGEY